MDDGSQERSKRDAVLVPDQKLEDSGLAARLLRNEAVFREIGNVVEDPSYPERDLVCEWLYEWCRKSRKVKEYKVLVLSNIPVILSKYLRLYSEGIPDPSLESILVCVYNEEVFRRRESPRVLEIPSVDIRSVFHTDADIPRDTALTESALRRLDGGFAADEIVEEVAVPPVSDAHNSVRSSVLRVVVDEILYNFSALPSFSRVRLCEEIETLCTRGYSFQFVKLPNNLEVLCSGFGKLLPYSYSVDEKAAISESDISLDMLSDESDDEPTRVALGRNLMQSFASCIGKCLSGPNDEFYAAYRALQVLYVRSILGKQEEASFCLLSLFALSRYRLDHVTADVYDSLGPSTLTESPE